MGDGLISDSFAIFYVCHGSGAPPDPLYSLARDHPDRHPDAAGPPPPPSISPRSASTSPSPRWPSPWSAARCSQRQPGAPSSTITSRTSFRARSRSRDRTLGRPAPSLRAGGSPTAPHGRSLPYRPRGPATLASACPRRSAQALSSCEQATGKATIEVRGSAPRGCDAAGMQSYDRAHTTRGLRDPSVGREGPARRGGNTGD